MSDRIAVMHRGRIEQVGVPEELYDRPATSFVADFIGTTNLLAGTVEDVRDGGALIRLESGDQCLIAADGRATGQSIQLSVRPEAIAIDAGNGSSGSSASATGNGRLHAEVEQVAYLGAAVQYHVRTAGGLGLSVLAGKTGSRFESGDSVVLAWAPSDALVLGDRSGEVEDAT